jgi:CRP/FNR family transcriptional regulator, cyclic AMP receptor protein
MADIVLPRRGPLAYLEEEVLALLSGYGVSHLFAKDSVIIRQDERQINLYIVISGRLEVFAPAEGRDIPLAQLEPGDCIGEVAIFEPGDASASVRALEDSRLWYLDAGNLQSFLAQYPHAGCGLLLGINAILSQRLQQANKQIKSSQIVPGFLSVRARRAAASTTP